MATLEMHIAGEDESPPTENLDPHHFYAAYVFESAALRGRDVAVLIHEAQRLSYPVRYWWLSEAMDLQDAPDRLIVCVHHPHLTLCPLQYFGLRPWSGTRDQGLVFAVQP